MVSFIDNLKVFQAFVSTSDLRKNKMIWSGSTENGRRDQTRYCNDWKSANDYFVGAAVDLRFEVSFLYYSCFKNVLRRGTTTALPCSTPLGVLCVDVAASGP